MQSTDVKTKSKVKRIVSLSVTALLLMCILLISFGKDFGIPSWKDIFTTCGIYADLGDDLSVSFIDVGSADACYITCHGKNILIDSGTSLSYDKLYAYLNRVGCTHFDAIIVSHPDSDHIGGMKNIFKDFGTDVLYMYTLPENLVPHTDEYKYFYNSIEEYKINVVSPKIASNITVGDLNFKFISPTKTYGKINDTSLVVKMTFENNSFLFTGDISENVEKTLINSNEELNCDVLKVAHHGSKTSSSQTFIDAVSPLVSVVSVGANDFDLPNYQIIARLSKSSDSLYRTDVDKTVVVTSDGQNIKVQTRA